MTYLRLLTKCPQVLFQCVMSLIYESSWYCRYGRQITFTVAAPWNIITIMNIKGLTILNNRNMLVPCLSWCRRYLRTSSPELRYLLFADLQTPYYWLEFRYNILTITNYLKMGFPEVLTFLALLTSILAWPNMNFIFSLELDQIYPMSSLRCNGFSAMVRARTPPPLRRSCSAAATSQLRVRPSHTVLIGLPLPPPITGCSARAAVNSLLMARPLSLATSAGD